MFICFINYKVIKDSNITEFIVLVNDVNLKNIPKAILSIIDSVVCI